MKLAFQTSMVAVSFLVVFSGAATSLPLQFYNFGMSGVNDIVMMWF